MPPRPTSSGPLLAALLVIPTLAAPASHAQPFSDLGPSLGLPSQLSGPSGQGLSAGLTALDLDGDGHLDLLANTPTLGLTAYLRRGPTFVVAPDLLPAMNSAGEVFGHTVFDADGDGDLDIHVLRNDGDRLFLRTPTGYIDATATHLPRALGWSATSTAVDFDGDGDLDLLLARYIDRIDFPGHRCFTNKILENDGHGVFTDITATLRPLAPSEPGPDDAPAIPLPTLADTRGCSFALVALDFDEDGDLDLLTVNDFAQFTGITELWRNDGPGPDGAWRFTEVSAAHGLVAPLYGMGAAFGDLDQDGRPELFLTSIGEPLLFERGPDHRFTSATTRANLYARFAHDRHQVTWTVRFEDLDADGYLDVLAAGGTLPAAPFIGNPNDMGSLLLMGRPDGRLAPLPAHLDFPRAGHSARDFEIVDLDGDGLPEIAAIHIHGRISVFKNLGHARHPTRLLLSPSSTGPNAAGALVTLTCGTHTRTRHVTAGGDYGNLELGEVRLHFPPPCDGRGHPATGTIRWPSGFTQALALNTGHTHEVTEPTWLTLTDDTVRVDLTHHLGEASTLALSGHNLEVSPPTLVAGATSRIWEASFTRPDPARASRLDIAVDAEPWHAHPRIPGASPSLSLGAVPVTGKVLPIRVRFQTPPNGALSVRLGTSEVPLTSLGPALYFAELVMPMSPGPATLELLGPGPLHTFELLVSPVISLFESELITRELHILAAEIGTRRARLRPRLFDANFETSGLSPESFALLLDGEPTEPDTRAMEGGLPTLGVEHTRLAHGTTLQLLLGDEPLFALQQVAQVARGNDIVPMVSPGRSRCWFSEPQLRADGEDRATAILQFNDAQGNRIPDFALRPSVDTTGMTIVPGTLTIGYGGWTLEAQAGIEPGQATLTAALPGQASPIRCELLLVAPPALPPPISGSPITIIGGPATIGEPLLVRVWPWDVDHRSLGSGVGLTAHVSTNATHTSPAYVGFGRYELSVFPLAEGPIDIEIRREEDGVPIASSTIGGAGGPGDVTEPGPEPGPEPSAETIELEADADGEPVAEVDAGAEPTSPDASPEASPEPVAESGPEPNPEPSLEDPEAVHAEPVVEDSTPSVGDGGCGGCAGAGSGPLIPVFIGLLGLALRPSVRRGA